MSFTRLHLAHGLYYCIDATKYEFWQNEPTVTAAFWQNEPTGEGAPLRFWQNEPTLKLQRFWQNEPTVKPPQRLRFWQNEPNEPTETTQPDFGGTRPIPMFLILLWRYLASGAAGDRDVAEARLWLERALAQGVTEAAADLAELRSPAEVE